MEMDSLLCKISALVSLLSSLEKRVCCVYQMRQDPLIIATLMVDSDAMNPG